MPRPKEDGRASCLAGTKWRNGTEDFAAGSGIEHTVEERDMPLAAPVLEKQIATLSRVVNGVEKGCPLNCNRNAENQLAQREPQKVFPCFPHIHTSKAQRIAAIKAVSGSPSNSFSASAAFAPRTWSQSTVRTQTLIPIQVRTVLASEARARLVMCRWRKHVSR